MNILDRLHWSEPIADESGQLWKEGAYSETGDLSRLGSLLNELTDAAHEAGGEVLQSEQSVVEGRDEIRFRCRVPIDNGASQ